MSLDSHSNIKSIHSICSHVEKKYDTIPFRLDFIKELLEGKELKPLIDLDNCETEYFLHPEKYNTCESGESDDTRKILNKKIHDFCHVITGIGGTLKYIK